MPLADYLTAPRRTAGYRQGLGPIRQPGGDLRQWAHGVVEKVRVAALGGHLRFLPWYDPYTEETPEIRQQYRIMLVDDAVKSAFQMKVLSVISQDVQFQPADDDSPRDQEVSQFCQYAFKKVRGGTPAVGWSILAHGIIDGHSVCEPVWREEPLSFGRFRGKRIFRTVKAKDTRYLQLGIDAYRNVTAIRGSGFNNSRTWSPDSFAIFTHLPLFENPAGMSDFRAAYHPYWIKRTIWELRKLHLEKFTGPFIKAEYATVEQKAALEQELQNASASTWMTVPSGALVECIDLAMRGTSDFKDAIDDCNKAILVAIAGAHLMIMEGQTVSGRGNTKVQQGVAELAQWWLSTCLATVYQEQLVAPLVEENYHGVDLPEVSMGAVAEEAILQMLQVDEIMQKLGAKLSITELYKKTGRQQPVEADDVLQPAGAGAGAPAPGPAASAGPEGGAGGSSLFAEHRSFCREGPNKGKPGPCPESRFRKESQRHERRTTPLSPEQVRAERDVVPLTPEQDQLLNLFYGGAGEDFKAMPERDRLTHTHALHHVVSRLPKKAVGRVQKHLSTARAAASSDVTTAEWVRRVPNGRELLGEHGSNLGFYDTRDGSLWVDGGEGVDVEDTRRGVWSHEIGHVIDGPKFELSSHQEWKDAFAAEVQGGQLSDYATTSAIEGFAEFARAAYGSDVPAEKVAQLFPKCVAFFKKRGLL